VRRLAKRVPLTADLSRAATLDELAEAGLPQELPFNRSWLTGTTAEVQDRPPQQQLQDLQQLSRGMPPEEFQALVEQYGAERPELLSSERAAELIAHLEDLAQQEAAQPEEMEP
jgi:hypothetical protein